MLCMHELLHHWVVDSAVPMYTPIPTIVGIGTHMNPATVGMYTHTHPVGMGICSGKGMGTTTDTLGYTHVIP